MTTQEPCPVQTCSARGTIHELVSHVEQTDDDNHSWATLGYKDADEYRGDVHRKRSETLEQDGQELLDHGKFEEAVDALEDALWHAQQTNLLRDGEENQERARALLSMIAEAETAAEVQRIDELVDQASNALDAGEEAHLGAKEDAAEAYDAAAERLSQARSVAVDAAPARVPELERRLQQVRVRQQSLDLSEAHRSLHELVVAARMATAEGDRAFQKSSYEDAVKHYETAADQYEILARLLNEFSFDGHADDSNVCDVCRERFDSGLDSWSIELGRTLQVCPSCALFGTDRLLPNPREIATEQRYVKENIESITEGNTGLEWMSSESTTTAETGSRDVSAGNHDTTKMIIQLTGTVQSLGRVPTAEDIDEYTDFGFLAYRDEFGSINAALREAGFDV
ncbi:homing endonuclease associated repeat-containing protein [Haloarchaeobius sp. DYHT-AS-18]|uniref:homing endonuclease associated repeat-containing protein n=1 Tax=Haloarchaeobius sp. DYHT-AS-18 TaxID=3446117 RepID=UPI003EBEB23C